MTVKSSSSEFTVAHPHTPKGATLHLSGILEIRDTLNSCQNNLDLLAEMFGERGEQDEMVMTYSSRLGMYKQLYSLSGTLAAIDQCLGQMITVEDSPLPRTPINE